MENITKILNERYAEIVLPNTVLLALGMTVGAVGNIAIISLYVSKIQDKKGDRYFIPVLAFIDCLGCVANGSFYTTDNAFLFLYPSEVLCRILIFLLTFASGFSAHVLLVIALQRYLLICRPFGKQLTLYKRRISLVIITVACLGYACPLIGIGGIRHTNSTFLNQTFESHMCVLSVETSFGTLVYFGTMALITVANILVTAGLYIPITRAIYRTFSFHKKNVYKNNKDRRISDSQSSSTQISHITIEETNINQQQNISIRHPKGEIQQKSSKQECKTIHRTNTEARKEKVKAKINLMFLIIILVYILSYIPTLAILIATYTLSDFTYLELSTVGINLWLFCARFLLLNHVINPFIYGYFDIKLRTEFAKLCCAFVKRKLDYSVDSQTT
ncbi:cholecystokinin receptor type A-like [Saccostrea echinata]|uniref:cholecystokinin receptor type A-like n=1 Tax=Saccostrea echinata TaxID=191078 RepID=UPI002A8157CB|nr:cholecystokinin receptor type A-like [Saccostrea echinata]